MRTRKTLVEGPTAAQHYRVSRPDEARIHVLQLEEYQVEIIKELKQYGYSSTTCKRSPHPLRMA